MCHKLLSAYAGQQYQRRGMKVNSGIIPIVSCNEIKLPDLWGNFYKNNKVYPLNEQIVSRMFIVMMIQI